MALSKQQRIAKDDEYALQQSLLKAGIEWPSFKFLNLIGKGTYGRVYLA